ncbi:uncharacterized protein DEA37_0015063 [Paragonimus westermani]|uniref:Transmembrane protein n=1 Tax=Paragonimus westermani TaxID=34504 RepID=A0A5J4NJT1_9TREM|nr:uncharacterized protein DEA37_0015063 [Paragonimus westermani]
MAFVLPVEPIPARYRSCNCLHVRTGTLLLAVFQIMVHFVVIAILTAALGRSTKFRDDVEYIALSFSVMSFIQWERFVSDSDRVPVLPKEVNLSGAQNQVVTRAGNGEKDFGHRPTYPSISDTEAAAVVNSSPYFRTAKLFMNSGEEYVAIAVTLLSLLFSIMMLVGTIYARPYYLLPYCCIQVGIFSYSSIFLVFRLICDMFICSGILYLSSGEWSMDPFTLAVRRTTHQDVLQFAICLLVILAGIVLLGLKAYLLAMVWLCYKFLLRYTTGLERGSGFAFAAGSCLLLLSWCQRLNCIRYAGDPYPHIDPAFGDQGGYSSSLTAQTQTESGRIFFLFRRPHSRSTNTTNSEVIPAEPCLPPKYEDVLAMPAGAFDPPPYASLAGEHTLTLPPGNGDETSPPPATNTESGDIAATAQKSSRENPSA